MINIKHPTRGQTLIELLLAIGLTAIILPAILTGLVTSRSGRAQQNQRLEAVALLKEAQEAVRNVREKDWNTFAVNGTFHPKISASEWILTNVPAGPETVNGFTRSVVISDVNRDANGAIVLTGGTLDPSTKKVVTTVSWSTPITSLVTSTSYIARLDNLTFTDTTDIDFNKGTKTGTTVRNAGEPGEVILEAGGGGGDWCQPSKQIKELDLPKNGVANAVTAIPGPANNESTVFAGTGDNASGVTFAKVDVPGAPPNPNIVATYTPSGSPIKTNAVFGESNYAYLATDTNSKEIVILDLTQFTDPPTNSNYKAIGSINLPGNINGNSIYVTNNKAYVLGSDKQLYVYNITDRAKDYGTADYSGKVGLSGKGKKVIVTGSYAYIATDATTNNFQIFDISGASNPTKKSEITIGSSQAGVDVYVNPTNPSPTRAYFATAYSSGKSDFFVIDITNIASPSKIGSGYDTNGMNPKGITVVTGNRAIIVGTGGTDQYQVIKVDPAYESAPPSCAVLQYNTGVNGVASVLQSGNGYAYSYIITGDVNAELKIILGGAGNQYSASGTFESGTFDAGMKTTFNRFTANIGSNDPTTVIKLQVAAASAIGGSCTGVSFTFGGPDPSNPNKLNTTKFFTSTDNSTIVGAIPFDSNGNVGYQNPGQCFRYKAFLTSSEPTQTPVLYDITVNYSP